MSDYNMGVLEIIVFIVEGQVIFVIKKMINCSPEGGR